MISKCANPACPTPFRYLREGKLFRVDVPADSSPRPGPGSHNVEHFWLCGRCCATMTLVYERSRGVIAVPLKALGKAS